MVRAIFFDFYTVWAPDTIQTLLSAAEAQAPEKSAPLQTAVSRYYHGTMNVEKLADTFRWELQLTGISPAIFNLQESQILPDVINFMRGLHGHFLKLGILANLGTMEIDFLTRFNTAQALFEAVVSPLSLTMSQPLLSREVFSEACKLIRERPDACVAVSGHDDYLAFAAKMGMQTIPFTTMSDLYPKLLELLAKDTPTAVTPYQPGA